ncbi:MAG: serine protease [Clostridium sp.]|nr:serine protease [Clostridium sp.]
MKIKNNINNKNFHHDNVPKIRFMRKKYRQRINLFIKAILYLVIVIIISIIASIFIFNIKHKLYTDEISSNIQKDSIRLQYASTIDIIKKSLVTISSSKENLLSSTYEEGNITGIIVDSKGRIITNYSAIKDFKDIYIQLPFIESEPVKGEIMVVNNENDIVVIEVKSDIELTPVNVATRDKVVEGEKVLLISNSTADEYIDNLIPGVITSTNRQLIVGYSKYNLYEINIPINKYNNGGVICNLSGEVIGIASEKISQDMNIDGLYYALDLSSLETVVNNIKIIKDTLGIAEGSFIYDENKENYSGMYVGRVFYNDSMTNGLKPTDIVLEVENNDINNYSDIIGVLKNKEIGDTVTCKVFRSGKVIELNIIINKLYPNIE